MIDLQEKHSILLKSILQKTVPGKDIRVFGSRVKGTARESSDIDLVLFDAQPLPKPVFTRLYFDIQDSDLPFRVDIIEWCRVSAHFKKIISREWEKFLF